MTKIQQRYILIGYFPTKERPNFEIIQETDRLSDLHKTKNLISVLKKELEDNKITTRAATIMHHLKKSGINPLYESANREKHVIQPSKIITIIEEKLIIHKAEIPMDPEDAA